MAVMPASTTPSTIQRAQRALFRDAWSACLSVIRSLPLRACTFAAATACSDRARVYGRLVNRF